MSSHPNPFVVNTDAEIGMLLDQYEDALHQGEAESPELWLLDLVPGDLRQRLADLHWLYRVGRPDDDTWPDRRSADDVDFSIPGYEMLGTLGDGGMGIVYKARHLRLNRVVAIKVLRAGAHARPDQRTRFQREAVAAARLKHENIVAIHEVGEHGGQPHLVLEFVESGSLKHRLDGNPQPARSAARLVEAVARAVQHAHEHGIVHRDLKPGNILLLGQDGPAAVPLGSAPKEEFFVPKVADFGLAKQLDGEMDPTQTGDIVGTPNYMAPEQAAGRSAEVGPAADVHALGVILYQMLTGQVPYKAENVLETLHEVRHAEPVPPRRIVTKTPRELETICLKCLQKEPARRYPTALSLADDLRRFLDGRPILARPAGSWERVFKWVKRNRLASALIATGILIAAMVLAFLVELTRSNRALKEAGEREHRLAEDAAWERSHALRQQELAAAHLQNALDLLEPLSIEVMSDHIAKTPDGQLFRQKFSSLASGFYRKLLADEDNIYRDIRRQTGRAYHGLGMSHAVLQVHQPAVDAFNRAIDLQEKLLNEFPGETIFRVDLAISYQSLGDEQLAGGDKAKASESYQKILPLFETLPPGLARVKHFAFRLAQQFSNMGKYPEAVAWLKRVGRYLEAAMQEEHRPDERVRLANALAPVYNTIAVLYMQLGDPVEAERFFEMAARIKEAKLPPASTMEFMSLRIKNGLFLKKQPQASPSK